MTNLLSDILSILIPFANIFVLQKTFSKALVFYRTNDSLDLCIIYPTFRTQGATPLRKLDLVLEDFLKPRKGLLLK